MEIINYLKKTTEELESIIVNDVTRTKKLNHYTTIKEFNDKLNELHIYIIKQKVDKPIKNEPEPEPEPELNSDSDSDSDSDSEPETINGKESKNNNETHDKYYISAKNRIPNAKESSIEYEAKILRERCKTHEEFEEYQKPKIEKIKELEKKYNYETTYEKMIDIGSILIKYKRYSDNTTYYKVIDINEKKNKIITKEIKKSKLEYINFDFPYGHRSATYYMLDENITGADKTEFALKQTRGKSKGEYLEYPQLLTKSGKWIIYDQEDLTN